jgi:hypothetical protein
MKSPLSDSPHLFVDSYLTCRGSLKEAKKVGKGRERNAAVCTRG